MSETAKTLISLLPLAVSTLAVWYLLHRERKLRGANVEELEATRQDLAALVETITQKDVQLVELTKKLDASQRANALFEESRNMVWDLYHRSSLGSANAQAWLMRELTATTQLVNRYRRAAGEPEIQTSRELQEVVQKFQQEFVDPTREEVLGER